MNLIKKLFTIALLLSCSMACTWAAKTLVVERKSGESTTFVLAEKPEISFSNHVLHISIKGSNTDFEISDVRQFYFTEAASDIKEVTNWNDIKMSFTSNDNVVFEGLSTIDEVRLYSADGKQFAGHVCFNNDRAEVSLQSLPKGTYLINISNKQTFKVIRK